MSCSRIIIHIALVFDLLSFAMLSYEIARSITAIHFKIV